VLKGEVGEFLDQRSRAWAKEVAKIRSEVRENIC
jgi:hypothetical protein